MARRIIYLLQVYLLTVFFFLADKVGFMYCQRDSQSFTVADVADVLRHGLTLDLSMSLYILSVPFLSIAASIWLPRESLFRRILIPYYVVIALAMALAFVADSSLYSFWLFKLNATCLQYLSTPTVAMASVTPLYLLLRLLAVLLLALLFAWAYCRVPLRLPPVRRRIIATIGAVLAIPLIVIGIRGGLGESTTNIGQVYYSQNQFLNHAAINPVFSFFESLEKTSGVVTYHFMDDADSQRLVNRYYDTRTDLADTLLNNPRPNIIVILLESCGSVFTEAGGRTDVMPHLNRLLHEGVYFTQCYGNTWRTDRGTVCTWSGYPSFPTMSVMKMPARSRSLPCMARTLQQQHYNTYYLYGGDINFTNMRSYLIGGGFAQLTSQDDYPAEERSTARWGVRDDITFQTLLTMTTTAQQPYLIGYSTLSSHQPWDVPISHFADEKLNAFYYLDQCLGRFVEQLRQSSQWENTLLVLLPDHGIPYGTLTEADPLKNRIPMLWLGGAIRQPRTIHTVCNQTDLPATLLGQMGIAHDDYTFSRDVLSTTYREPFAVNTYDDGINVYDSSSFVSYDLLSQRIVAQQGSNASQLLQRGKALLQAAAKDLNER